MTGVDRALRSAGRFTDTRSALSCNTEHWRENMTDDHRVPVPSGIEQIDVGATDAQLD